VVDPKVELDPAVVDRAKFWQAPKKIAGNAVD
jgi:hypothetical protein